MEDFFQPGDVSFRLCGRRQEPSDETCLPSQGPQNGVASALLTFACSKCRRAPCSPAGRRGALIETASVVH